MSARMIVVTALGFVALACANGINVGAFHDPVDAGPGDAVGETVAIHLPAQLQITPGPADFGSVRLGEASAPRTFTVANVGGVDTTSLEVVASQTSFGITSDDCTKNVLAPGGSCVVVVVFTPLGTGDASAVLEVSEAPADTASVTLTGVGAATALLTIDPDAVDFDMVTSMVRVAAIQNPIVTFSIKNVGMAPSLPLVSSVMGLRFAITSPTTCDGPLGFDETCKVSVGFYRTPACPGPDAGAMTIFGTLRVTDGHVTVSANLVGTPLPCPGP